MDRRARSAGARGSRDPGADGRERCGRPARQDPRGADRFAAASEVDALSGTIEQTSELGLPDLGALTGSTGDESSGADGDSPRDIDDLIALVTGSHTAKVYLDGESARLQVLDQLGERNVYVDGEADEVWYVDSETQTATRSRCPRMPSSSS